MLGALWIAFWTLVIYSTISTLMITISENDDDVTACFAYGIVGITIGIIRMLVRRAKNIYKYHFVKK